MALQVEIELCRVYHVGVHDGAGWAIPALISDAGSWEESNVVAFSNNNDSDCWIYSSVLAGS